MTRRTSAPVVTLFTAVLLILLGLGSPSRSHAHFGMVIPEQPVITQHNKTTNLSLSFSHPFENIGMDLDAPAKFFVTVNGKVQDLTDTLTSSQFMDHNSWSSGFSFKRPGIYTFVMEPSPYWEPAEDVFIIHYTKTIIPAYGEDQGWDKPAGLPVEIIPRTRPFGNYAGNSFTGQVLIDGKPAPNTEVEVELYNTRQLSAPSDYHITQVVATDDNGIFHFTCPLPGWWGFAALTEAPYTLKDKQGAEKGVELGGVLWTYFDTPLNTEQK
ncbi:DUF4198 domain-containing protein [Desulforhopalus singaporensis]|uniref:Cobalt/nickel transport protein n=1 Tax=Desulforhopalus singaporensis TaxID=91360 RepID=A0A1H0KSG0_9BACT|nr:DUF4198 domain-containing protein [Desulforhopalus singaporensis]SDO58924.1 cobalt/nickel transport protein [Desulforhopalus singaporensis]